VQPSPADRRAAQRRRELNLAIVAISTERGLVRPIALACECGHPQCMETLPLEPAAFEALLAQGQSVLAPLHRAAADAPVRAGATVQQPVAAGV
jgi:hypothetical protein